MFNTFFYSVIIYFVHFVLFVEHLAFRLLFLSDVGMDFYVIDYVWRPLHGHGWCIEVGWGEGSCVGVRSVRG